MEALKEIITEINPSDLKPNEVFNYTEDQLELGYRLYYGDWLVHIGIIFILNLEDNVIEHSYWYSVAEDGDMNDSITVGTAIPQTISLSIIEDEQCNVAKLMYTKAEYFKYLVKNKINLNYLKAVALDQVEAEIYHTESQLKCDIQNPLNLSLRKNASKIVEDLKTNSYLLEVSKYYKGKTILMEIKFIFPVDDRLKVYYTYKIYNKFIDKEFQYRIFNEQHEVRFTLFELRRHSYERICNRLVEVYHIVDDVFRQEIAKANEFLNKTKSIGENS